MRTSVSPLLTYSIRIPNSNRVLSCLCLFLLSLFSLLSSCHILRQLLYLCVFPSLLLTARVASEDVSSHLSYDPLSVSFLCLSFFDYFSFCFSPHSANYILSSVHSFRYNLFPFHVFYVALLSVYFFIGILLFINKNACVFT